MYEQLETLCLCCYCLEHLLQSFWKSWIVVELMRVSQVMFAVRLRCGLAPKRPHSSHLVMDRCTIERLSLLPHPPRPEPTIAAIDINLASGFVECGAPSLFCWLIAISVVKFGPDEPEIQMISARRSNSARPGRERKTWKGTDSNKKVHHHL